MILHTVPVPGRDGDTLRDIYSDVHGDIPVARRVYHKVADEIVKRCNAYEQLSDKLPCSYYMDPPDGGSVTILEQLWRAMDDAKKYRTLVLAGYVAA